MRRLERQLGQTSACHIPWRKTSNVSGSLASVFRASLRIHFKPLPGIRIEKARCLENAEQDGGQSTAPLGTGALVVFAARHRAAHLSFRFVVVRWNFGSIHENRQPVPMAVRALTSISRISESSVSGNSSKGSPQTEQVRSFSGRHKTSVSASKRE